MRIITGRARGLKLFTPKDYRVRPTSDRVKEALFNILAPVVQGSTVLDVFAGTGNLGLEAWSRGAADVTFLDESEDSLLLVRKNIAKAKAEKETCVLKGNSLLLLERLYRQGKVFDIIFSDPPYRKGLNEKILQKLQKLPLLKQGGILVFEYSQEEELPGEIAACGTVRTEKYGDTKISLLLWKYQ